MKPVSAALLLAAVLFAPVAFAAEDAKALVDLVDGSDLIVFGRVTLIDPGRLDPDSLDMGVQKRTDVATIVVAEVIKGDPELAVQRVKVGFPGFPKEGEATVEENQEGIWLLTKSDQDFYVLKSPACFQPTESLGAVRRATRRAGGTGEEDISPEARAKRATELLANLAPDKPEDDRRHALYRIGELGELSTVPTLINTLNDPKPGIRLAADLALRKITGHRSGIDFRNSPEPVRARGVDVWTEWWEENRTKSREEILLEAARGSERPKPDLRYAIEGLAPYGDPALLLLFNRTFEVAVNAEDNGLAAAAARYFGRIKSREAVPGLVGLLEKGWTTPFTQTAAIIAVGAIVGEDFGVGGQAIANCLTWWAKHKDEFE